jgi:hypothetical protein
MMRAVSAACEEAAAQYGGTLLRHQLDAAALLSALSAAASGIAERLGDDSVGAVVEFATAAHAILRMLFVPAGSMRLDYLLCRLAAEDPEWIDPLKRRADWLVGRKQTENGH